MGRIHILLLSPSSRGLGTFNSARSVAWTATDERTVNETWLRRAVKCSCKLGYAASKRALYSIHIPLLFIIIIFTLRVTTPNYNIKVVLRLFTPSVGGGVRLRPG